MRVRSLVAPLAVTAAVGALVIAPGAGSAATPSHMVGFAGGTMVHAVGTTVTSGMTSESNVDTDQTGVTNQNALASVDVTDLVHVGAITSSASTVAVPGGVSVVTHARTANVNLLDGAIIINAVDTVDTASIINGNPSHSVNTTFVGLKIGNSKLPATISQNFNINIPNVAQVVLNGGFESDGGPGSGTIMTEGAGLYLSLLHQRGNNMTGTQVWLNPTYAAIAPTKPVTGANIGGFAYGSAVYAAAGQLLNAQSGPTAQISQPMGGTGGVNKVNSTATVNLAPVLTVGAITDTANGVKSPGTGSYSTMTTKLAGISLLNGLIKADALTGVASVKENPDGSTTATTATSFVNLVIAGKSIPINVSPNTVINLANVGTITIRAEAHTANQALVHVLVIKITTASYGLPVGAVIQVGVAAAWVITA